MEIKQVKKITDEKWINLCSVTYSHNGKEGEWTYATRREPGTKKDGPDAVIIVPILHRPGQEPCLVMIKEYRIPLGAWIYALPAGLVEEGERVEEVATRELMEETGLQVTKVKKISPPLTASAGLTDETGCLAFVDAEQTEDGKQALDEAELLEVLHLSYEEVCALCDQTETLVDARAWGALYLYQQLGRLS